MPAKLLLPGEKVQARTIESDGEKSGSQLSKVPLQEILPEFFKSILQNGESDFSNQIPQEMQVVPCR